MERYFRAVSPVSSVPSVGPSLGVVGASALALALVLASQFQSAYANQPAAQSGQAAQTGQTVQAGQSGQTADRIASGQYGLLTLTDQFLAARQFDPQYLGAFAARDAAEQGLAYAESAFGPKVSLSGSAFRTNRVEESTNFLGRRTETNREFNSTNAQIQARQPIYRPRDSVARDQSMAQLESAQSVLQFAEQDLAFRLVGRWIELVAAQETVDLLTSALQASIEVTTEAERRLKAGETSIQEVDLLRARMMQAEAQLIDAKAQQEIAARALKDIAGPRARVPQNLSVKGLNQLPHRLYLEDELISLLEEKNFEIQAARFLEESALLERDKAKSDRKPTLDAYVSASKGENDSVSSVKDENRIGLQLSMPLFTSGALSAVIAQAEANYRKAQAQTKATSLRIRSEALSANVNLASLVTRIAAADRSAKAAELALTAYQKGLKAGVNSRAEVAQAMQDLSSAQRQQILVRKDYGVAWLKLNQLLSGFDEPMLIEIQAKLLLRR